MQNKHVRLAKEVCKQEIIKLEINQRSQYPTFCFSVFQKCRMINSTS